MEYAIIRVNKKQYSVKKGSEILVDKYDDKDKIETLLFVDGARVIVGKPVLEKAKVEIKVLGEEKGKKIKVLKYKAKSRYRKSMGSRPTYKRLQIGKVTP